jgi:hypothetical protein
VATLTGHTLRVLYLAMSPDGQVNPLKNHIAAYSEIVCFGGIRAVMCVFHLYRL